MTTELVRNPKRRRGRRNPKLSRAKKVGIALVSVAAVGGIAAAFMALRRRPDEIDGGQGSQGPLTSGVSRGTELRRATRRMCLNPDALTLEQMLLLQQELFLPILASMPNPNSYANVAVLTQTVLEQHCATPPSAAASSKVGLLAQRTWENFTGFGG